MDGPLDPDELRLVELGAELADRAAAAIGPWVERSVVLRHGQWAPSASSSDRVAVAAAAREAGLRAAADVGPSLHALLAADPAEQRTTPLALVRDAVVFATKALRALGVPPVVRDAAAEHAFPGDVYDLTPAQWGDVDPSLVEPGIAWGAAKAHVLVRRHRGGR